MKNKEVSSSKSMLRLKDDYEEVPVTFHNIMPGIELLYNRFNVNRKIDMEYSKPKNKILELNYCEAGRFGCIINENRQVFLGEGEMEVNIADIERKNSEFPLGFYNGITIIIDTEEFKQQLKNTFLEEISEKITELYKYLVANDFAVLIKPNPQIIKIFRAFYEESNKNNILFMKLKIIEILMLMQTIPYNENINGKQYFSGETINKIKKAHDEVTSNLENKITLNELAEKYKIGLTNFKKCFKEIYGSPYYTYLKRYKIHKAIHNLEETNMSISEIAEKVGYENTSKFISAFKELVGYTPREYKNKNVRMEHLNLFGVEIINEK